MPPSQARERLLTAAMERAQQSGITDLSLRELAEAIGTSHRMLLYHFGSREGLLGAVCTAANEQEAAEIGRIARWHDPWEFFAHVTDPQRLPAQRLFFELYVHALYGRPGTEGFFDVSVDGWLSALTDQLVGAGTKPEAARPQARLALAVIRGLLLDLLATGDEDGATRAFLYYLQVASPFS